MVATVAVRIITDLITGVIRVPLLWRWAIDLITFTEVVITKAAPITSGSQAIGQHATGKESGSTAITSSGADINRAIKERLSSRRGAIWRSPFLEQFKRSVAPGPSGPNENAQPWPGSLNRNARSYGN
jgi:hypothetical protein